MQALQIGQTIEMNNVRIHRYQWSISVTNIEFAGKRGKSCQKVSAYTYGSYDGSDNFFNELSDKLLSCGNFNEMVESVKAASEKYSNLYFQETTERGVDVAPSNEAFSEIEIHNEGVYVKVDWDSFAIRDKKDMNNEPTLISLKRSHAHKLHKILSKNPEAYKNYSFSDFWNLCSEANIPCHYYCAMD